MIERIPDTSVPSVLFLIGMAPRNMAMQKSWASLKKLLEISLLEGLSGSISLKHVFNIQWLN